MLGVTLELLAALGNLPLDRDHARKSSLGPCPDAQERGGLGEKTGGFAQDVNECVPSEMSQQSC